jgi:signal transduction histidine kinase
MKQEWNSRGGRPAGGGLDGGRERAAGGGRAVEGAREGAFEGAREGAAAFRRIYIVVVLLIAVLGLLFIGVTYLATTSFYAASTQLLNKDVAGHIAKFTSPYGREGFDRQKADSVFYQAMVISPSAEVYFLDTTGRVIYFHGDTAEIKNWRVDMEAVRRYLGSGGLQYISGLGPRDPEHRKIFSAAGVGGLGYIYVIFGNQQYRSVTQMLVNSRVTPAALEAALLIVVVSLAVTVVYIRRARRRFELIENTRRAVASEKERRDFMTNMSHDLRTPLAIARGYAETLQLKRGELSVGEEREYGELVLGKIRQVEKMVERIFELSKMEAASFELRREPFVFSEVVQEVVRAVGAGRVVCGNCEDGAWVEADVSMMERVLQNLVVNAVAYTRVGGRIVISLTRDGEGLVCRVANEGEGLGEGLGDDIVGWFNGVEGVRPKKSAIGLSIVKRVLEMHGFAFGAEVNGGIGRNGGNGGNGGIGRNGRDGGNGGMNTFWFRMAVVG